MKDDTHPYRDRGRAPARAGVATLVVVLVLVLGAAAKAPAQYGGRSVQGDGFRAQGRYLRGMAWYELGAAQAGAIEADAVAAWNRAVQADYNQYMLDRARRAEARKALRNEREEDAARRLEALRRRWREAPTVDDVRSALALNALASDLADPQIPAARWAAAPVELPARVTVASLAFRFADAPKGKLPAQLAAGTVAVDRMKGEHWPVSLRRPELERARGAYRRAVAGVVAACERERRLSAPEVDAVRDALFTIKAQASEVVPASGGQRKQALAYLDRLDEATKIFLDRDFAEELIRDVERHRARTVGQLLGFMKKYRLLFAESDDDPESWAVYQTLYGLLRRQKADLDAAPAAPEGRDGPRR
jgi:hypothetical protein